MIRIKIIKNDSELNQLNRITYDINCFKIIKFNQKIKDH